LLINHVGTQIRAGSVPNGLINSVGKMCARRGFRAGSVPNGLINSVGGVCACRGFRTEGVPNGLINSVVEWVALAQTVR